MVCLPAPTLETHGVRAANGLGWLDAATTQESFYAWVDIQEFREIPTADYRRGKSMHIYQKYIREGAVLEVRAARAANVQQKLAFYCSIVVADAQFGLK